MFIKLIGRDSVLKENPYSKSSQGNHEEKKNKGYRSYPLWLCMGVIFTTLMICVWFTLSFSSYRMIKKTTLSATVQLGEHISKIMELFLKKTQMTAYSIVESLAHDGITESTNWEERLQSLPSMTSSLIASAVVNSIFIGYEDGDFFVVRALRTEEEKRFLKAPAKAFFIVQNSDLEGEKRLERIRFYDEDLNALGRDIHIEGLFDARTRPWYINAMDQEGNSITDPYVFYETDELGITVSHRSIDGQSVVGLDMNLETLSQMLEAQLPTPRSRVAIARPDGGLIAQARGLMPLPPGFNSNDNRAILTNTGMPVLFRGLEAYNKGERGLLHNIQIDGESWTFYVDSMQSLGADKGNLLLLALPVSEVMGDADALLVRNMEISLLILLMSLPIVWLASQRIAKPLRILALEAEKVKDFHFEADESDKMTRTYVIEVEALANAISSLKRNVKSFLTINSTINNERDFETLLSAILMNLVEVANAEGGFICLLDDHEQYLPEVKAYWKHAAKQSDALENVSLSELEGLIPLAADVEDSRLIHMTVSREDALAVLAPAFDDPEVHCLDILHLPLFNNMDEYLGLLTFIETANQSQSNFQEQHVPFIKALADTATVALEDHRLLEAQRTLLDAMVQIIAGAIDAKSPYTGAHCQRVPVISEMIFEAANDATEGIFRDFKLTGDEWEEASLAAWLHDCGKVTTPEFVVDKATKLETIYDRIHEVRMRFEVLKRDAQIACLQDILSGSDPADRNRQMEEELTALDGEFSFVAQCNTGSEFLDEETLDRLKTVGQRVWTRTLDKRLGVSRDERARMEATSESLPVQETLLSDKPEHVITHFPGENIEERRALGIKVELPENLYNRGELYNLTVKRGTLSFEERCIINDHMTQTIFMLDRLPWPKRMKNVPLLAGGHHETMDGKGYPRRLTKEEIDVRARMIAVADIFEALTASDRPYKSAKTLTEAMAIMEDLKDRHHIDPDVYDLFIQEEVHLKYAKKYLRPEQLDM